MKIARSPKEPTYISSESRTVITIFIAPTMIGRRFCVTKSMSYVDCHSSADFRSPEELTKLQA